MKTPQEDEWTETDESVIEQLRTQERMEGVEGLERSLVAQAAERAERQGGVEERSREGKRVAPGEAEAAIRTACMILSNRAAEREHDAERHAFNRDEWNQGLAAREAAWLQQKVNVLRSLLPEPDSGADAPASTPAEQPSTEAQP